MAPQALLNLARGSLPHARAVAAAGAVPKLERLLSRSAWLSRHALWVKSARELLRVLAQLPAAPRVCAACSTTSGRLRRCGGCGAVRFCSEACMRPHWHDAHKVECRRMQAEWAQQAAAAAKPASSCSIPFLQVIVLVLLLCFAVLFTIFE